MTAPSARQNSSTTHQVPRRGTKTSRGTCRSLPPPRQNTHSPPTVGPKPPSRCSTTPAGWARVSTPQCPRIANPPQHRPVMVKVQSRKLPNARFMTHTLPGFSFLHPVFSITQGPGPAKKNPPRNGGKSVPGRAGWEHEKKDKSKGKITSKREKRKPKGWLSRRRRPSGRWR